MEEILNVENIGENNSIVYINKPKKLLLELLNIYSYDEVMNTLLNNDFNKNILLEIKLKELVDKVDIMELAQLLLDEEIIQYNKIINVGNNNKKTEQILTNLDKSLKLENDKDVKKITKRKKREKPKPIISKILYKNNENIYIYRYVTSKKGDIISLKCQDKSCKSKAFYNFMNKEINIYENHSIPIEKHTYLNDRTSDSIKELVNFMKEKSEIKSLEIYSDYSKKIIENLKESKKEKKIVFNTSQINNNSSLLNKKRNSSPKFSTLKYKNKNISKNTINQKSNKIKNNNLKFLIETKNELDISQEENKKDKQEIININENDEKNKIISLNEKEAYFEIKDKYLKHNNLLTEIEQKYFGENKRLGTHFYKNEKGEIYNYFGNNKEIKDTKMNYRCTLKNCKSTAFYDLKTREFKIIKEHTQPYENHSCSNHNNNKTKKMIEYLKNNQDITDLQLILF